MVIIGAGLAGLRAARDLRDAGIDTVVLEAQERIGGRVHTDYAFANFPVERGAEFLHGRGTASWNLARKAGLAILEDVEFDIDDDVIVFLNGARQFRSDLAADPDLALVFDNDLDFAELADIEADDQSIAEVIASLDLSPLASHLLAQDASLEESGPVAAISAFATDQGVDAPGGDFRLRDGYSQLAGQLGKAASTLLATPVEAVDWSQTPLRVTTARGVIEADRVLVTASVAVLKAGLIEFTPPLPDDKQAALEGLGMGPIVKILVRYDRAFWPAGTSTVITDGDPPLWWMPATPRDDQTLDPVVIGFAGDTLAARIAGFDETAVKRVAADELARLFGPAAGESHMLAFSSQDWSANPWVRGGYAYVRTGRFGARAALAAPVDDRLFFAGEATDPLSPTTTHAAIDSGARAAAEIMAVAAA